MSATFPVFIIGLLWDRANEAGVMTGMAASLVLNLLSLTSFKWPGECPATSTSSPFPFPSPSSFP
jgi:Na+/proline symporter